MLGTANKYHETLQNHMIALGGAKVLKVTHEKLCSHMREDIHN